MMRIIATPFGWIMKAIYLLVKNYGIALLLFSIVIKLLMLPSSIKQQLSSRRTARIAPKLEQIRKKYANNKDKLNEATMELYNQEGISPTGGCGSMIITYVILFAIIEVVYAPLSFISGLPKDKINTAVQTVADYYNISQAVANDKEEGADVALTFSQRLDETTNVRELVEKYNGKLDEKLRLDETRLDAVVAGFEETNNLDEYFNDAKKFSKRLIAGGTAGRAELLILSVARDYPQLFDPEVVDFCNEFDYTFMGAYLGAYPSWSSLYILIPIISLMSQLALTVLSGMMMKKNNPGASAAKGMMGMLYVMPIISFIIAFSFPAGIGIYWIFSSVLALIQTVALNLIMTPERMDRMIEKQTKKKSRKPSLYQLALEQQKAQNGGSNGSLLDDLDENKEVKLSKNERKEVERQRINEARKRFEGDDADEDPRVAEARRKMAEKYGDDLD